jgi:uncharacterized protein (TIGR03437 family)
LTCQTSAVPLTVRSEGLTERVGDLSLICTGGDPSSTVIGNFTIFLNVAITNKIVAANATDVQFTYDLLDSNGPHLSGVPGILSNNLLTFSGVSFPLNSSGGVNLRISNIRANATALPAGQNSIQASIAVNGAALLPLTQSQLIVAFPQASLLDGFSGVVVCDQKGSPGPAKLSFAAYIAAGASFNSTRITEGFASAFAPKADPINFNGGSGERFLITYSGLPDGAQLAVPDVIAGSDSLLPTAGGDMGAAASGGSYAPTPEGSLLLARVYNSDASGAGGNPVYTPGVPGSGAVNFDTLGKVSLVNGAGTVVYEVVDANDTVVESAQFPTFLSLPANVVSGVVFTTETVSYAPVSTIGAPVADAAVPRFIVTEPGPDCVMLRDCNAAYFPRAVVSPSSVTFTGTAGGGGRAQYVQVNNAAGGTLAWQAVIDYADGGPSGWVQIAPQAGIGRGSIYVYVDPSQLEPGTYHASLNISAGPSGTPATLAITFNVGNAPPPPGPVITGITSAADFQLKTVAPGSLATIFGTGFGLAGATATMGGAQATVLFQNSTQLNVLVPASIAGQTSVLVVVNANGQNSPPATVPLNSFEPGIFANGVLNQDNSLNSKTHPAAPGSVIQIFATGLSGQGNIQAKIGDTPVAKLQYAGPAPNLVGVQQVNLPIPPSTSAGPIAISVCGGTEWFAGVCSAPYTVYTGN